MVYLSELMWRTTRAFLETTKFVLEVSQMVTEAAQKGDPITRREVRQLTDEWTAIYWCKYTQVAIASGLVGTIDWVTPPSVKE